MHCHPLLYTTYALTSMRMLCIQVLMYTHALTYGLYASRVLCNSICPASYAALCIVMHVCVSPTSCNIIQLIPYTLLYICHVCLIRTTHHAILFVRRLMHPHARLCMYMWHLPYASVCISGRMHCDEWFMHVYSRLCVM